jgi:hypothetical protein
MISRFLPSCAYALAFSRGISWTSASRVHEPQCLQFFRFDLEDFLSHRCHLADSRDRLGLTQPCGFSG